MLNIHIREMGVNQSKNEIEEMVEKFSKVKYSEVVEIDSFSAFDREKKKIQPKEQSHSLLKEENTHFYGILISSLWSLFSVSGLKSHKIQIR